jgi:hypothetical protein
MSRGHTDLTVQVDVIIKAWTTHRPGKSYGGLSLEDFKALVAPSRKARAEAAQYADKAHEAQLRCKDADKLLRKYVQRVVSGVRADPEDGEDGELYAAMGYVPRSARISLRSIRRRDAATGAETKSADGKSVEQVA